MEEWLKVSLLLSTYGFLKEFRPIEPFIQDYLTSPYWNLTTKEVQEQVMSVTTQSYLTFLVVAFLITDLVRYRLVILVTALFGVIMYSLFLWMDQLIYAQIAEVLHGAYQAGEVAYFTYIYAKVPKEYYRKVTSYTRASALLGKFGSAALAQFLVYFTNKDYEILNMVTIIAMVGAFLWVGFLLPAQTAIGFDREEPKAKYRNAFAQMWKNFVGSFSTVYVLKWSIWWAFATAGFLQVKAYSQPMWSVINESELHDGAVDASLSLIGFLSALSTGFLNVNWQRWGVPVLSVGTTIQGCLMILCSITTDIYVGYGCYVVFGGLYYSMITVAAAEVAKHVVRDSYGLVFGLNTVLALAIQSRLTLFLITVFAVTLRDQFLIYGVYHIIIAVLLAIACVISIYF